MLAPVFRRVPALLLLGLAAVTCATPRALGPPPTSLASCKSAGGAWAEHGGTFYCDRPTSDAGRRCSDSRDCLSFCIVAGDPRDCDDIVAPNNGVCYERELSFGCHCMFEAGRRWMQCADESG